MNKLLLLACTFLPSLLLATPEGMVVKTGQGMCGMSDSTLHIITSDYAELDWQSFSITENEMARFLQPSSTSIVINRVVGTTPSSILGKLEANGKVFLVNPHGIYIGPGATIDASSFLGSTFDLLDKPNSTDDSFSLAGTSEALVENAGTIKAKWGDVYLVGKNVKNSGTLEADKGCVGLASGRELMIKPQGSRHIWVKSSPIQEKKKGVGIQNDGILRAAQIEIESAGSPYELAIKDCGTTSGDKVFSVAHDGRMEMHGSTTAKNGQIHFLGKEILLSKSARLDTSAENGGGSVWIGKTTSEDHSSIPNTQLIFVENQAKITSNATNQGDGGKVTLWADETNLFFGHIEAKSGLNGGERGIVEVLSPKWLGIKGEIDTSPSKGNQ